MKLYVNFQIPKDVEEALEKVFAVTRDAAPDVDAALVVNISPEELEKMPRLRFIQVATAGLDHLPWSHIPPHVTVAGNAGSNADAVTEFAIALLLAAYKKVLKYAEKMRRGDYNRDIAIPQVAGSKIAVLGVGEIGSRVARVLSLLGAEVWAFARSPREGPWRFTNSLEDALRRASAAVCALPLNKTTANLVKYDHLALMREEAVFVNVGRAEVIDRSGLLKILRERPSFMYVSDVWWSRGDFSKDSEFYSMPNVVATPWVAGGYGSVEVWHKMMRQAAENVMTWALGGQPRNVAKREDYES